MAADKRCIGFVTLCFFVCVIVLIITGVLVAKPGLHTLQFPSVECSALSYQQKQSVPCGGERVLYACYLVNVTYNANVEEEMVTLTSIIRQSDATPPDNIQCSLLPECSGNPDATSKEVQQLFDLYGKPGSNYTCFYNPDAPTEVIIERKFPEGDIIAALAVPAIFAFIALVILCVLIITGRPKKPAKYSQANTTQSL